MLLLQNKPGVGVPRSDEAFERAGALRIEIAELAQTAPGGERHEDRLTRLSLLIGTAAVGAVVIDTEGPEAGEKWRTQNGDERLGAGDRLVRFFRNAWQRWRQDKARAAAIAPGQIIALNARANARKPG
ncbi:MAG: hypothetical protein WBG92_02750 [Thiohalocapsa sp.]